MAKSQRKREQAVEQEIPRNLNDNGASNDPGLTGILMKTYNRLFEELCSMENLRLAFKKARKGKTKKW